MRKKKYVVSYFVCPECSLEMPLPRMFSKMRKRGHIKDIYCPNCQKITKFVEIGQHDFYKNMDGEVCVNKD